MRKLLLTLLTVPLIIVAAGCTPAASADVLKSSEPRETPTELYPGDRNTLVEGNNAFAFDLYKQVGEGTDNLFFSPFSISLALAMTYAGAAGDTESQMADAMRFYLSQERLHEAFNGLDQELAKRGEHAQGKDDEAFRLNIVNAIWGQQDYHFREDYLDLLARNYGAGLRVLDFQSEPEPSREIINRWVEEQTENRIKDLIPQGAIDSLTRLVLTNAIYFNAAWQSQFEKGATTQDLFYLLDGTELTVPMMNQTSSYRYASGSNFQAVELPYDGNEISMVILLPDQGHYDLFEGALDQELVGSVMDDLQSTRIALSMPRFNLETTLDLKQALQAMGMVDAFDANGADFSGMDGTMELYISDVLHKAFVEVDEDGTEAAAATAVVVGTTSIPADPIRVSIDRPFIFLIQDIETNSILFLGRVMNPA